MAQPRLATLADLPTIRALIPLLPGAEVLPIVRTRMELAGG